MLIKGVDPYAGPHDVTQFLNPKAFTQPCVLDSSGNPTSSPAGCVALSGLAALGGQQGQVAGPGFHRLDFSTFKEFPIKERFHLQFRAEMFNILNHPNFNSPGFGGNGVVAIANALNFTSANFFNDVRIARTISFGERMSLDAMVDIFNVANRYNVAAVSPLFTNAGQATAAYDPRQIQFAVKFYY